MRRDARPHFASVVLNSRAFRDNDRPDRERARTLFARMAWAIRASRIAETNPRPSRTILHRVDFDARIERFAMLWSGGLGFGVGAMYGAIFPRGSRGDTRATRRRIPLYRSVRSGTCPSGRVRARIRPTPLPSRTNHLGNADARRTPSGSRNANRRASVRRHRTAARDRIANRPAAARRSRPSRNANTARNRRRSRFRSVRTSRASSFRIVMRRNRGFAS